MKKRGAAKIDKQDFLKGMVFYSTKLARFRVSFVINFLKIFLNDYFSRILGKFALFLKNNLILNIFLCMVLLFVVTYFTIILFFFVLNQRYFFIVFAKN